MEGVEWEENSDGERDRDSKRERAKTENDRIENTPWHVLRTLLFRMVCARASFFLDNFAAAAAAFIQLIRECSMRIYNSCSILGSIQLYSTVVH